MYDNTSSNQLNGINWKKDKELIRSNISILAYAEHIGLKVIKKGHNFFIQDASGQASSCHIHDKNNTFIRYSNGHNGDIFEFVKEYEGLEFVDAFKKLYPIAKSGDFTAPALQDTIVEKKKFRLPHPDYLDQFIYNNDVIRYLNKDRGIPSVIINDMIKRKMLYQSDKKACVFIGYNERKLACWGMQRSVRGNYKGDLPGNDYSVGWYVDNQASTTVVVESPIEALSYMGILEQKHQSYKNYNFLALGGISKLNTLIENINIYHPQHVIMAFNNDKDVEDRNGLKCNPGQEANEKAKGILMKKGYKEKQISFDVPDLNDWNDTLKDMNKGRTLCDRISKAADKQIVQSVSIKQKDIMNER